MKQKLTLLLLVFIASQITLSAQCLQITNSLDSRIDQCELAIEGKVVNQYSFFDEADNIIYTANVIDIYKVLKGAYNKAQIEVITLGGTVGSERWVVSPSLNLSTGVVGTFLLHTYQGNQIDNSRAVIYRPTGVSAGVIRYDFNNQKANDISRSFESLSSFYQYMEQKTGEKFKAFKTLPQVTPTQNLMMPAITTISPTTTQAGQGQVVTITGTGFGTTTGVVAMPNANNGGTSSVAVTPSSWSNTSITFVVPSGVGTGNLFIQDSGGTNSNSVPITVQYNLTNTNGEEPGLIDDMGDGDGGYLFKYSTSTANNGVDITSIPDAMIAMENAAASWANATGFPVFVGEDCGTTTIQAPSNDGVNIISFDSDATNLGGGVLGVCYSQYSACGPSDWELVGIDMLMRRDGSSLGSSTLTWNYSGAPAAGQSDFESVALHELGHGHQMGHVIDNGAVMHWTITTGTSNTSPDANDIAGGTHVITNNCTGYNPPVINCGSGNDFNLSRQCLSFDPSLTLCVLPLPVEWLSFEGKALGKNVRLDWSTASEQDNDFFTIEHSTNGLDFNTIGRVDAQGYSFSTQYYDFVHEEAVNGINYYRLSQTDYSGRIEWIEKIVSVEIEGDYFAAIEPNPVVGNYFNLKYYTEQSGTLQVEILDVAGRQLFEDRFEVARHHNVLDLSIPSLSEGVYIMRLQQDAHVETLRFFGTNQE